MFRLVDEEYCLLKPQISNSNVGRGKHRKYLPWVFTELGVVMLSSVLNTERAIEANISIVKAFSMLRQKVVDYSHLERRMYDMEKGFNELKALLSSSIQSGLDNAKLNSYINNPPSQVNPPTEVVINADNNQRTKVMIDVIMKSASEYYDMKVGDLTSHSRLGNIPLARQIVIYLIRQQINLGFSNIGKLFGRNHSSIIYSYQKIKNKLAHSARIKGEVEEINRNILSVIAINEEAHQK
jgi:hypothetical protein